MTEHYGCLNTLMKLNHFLRHTGKAISLNLGHSSLGLQFEVLNNSNQKLFNNDIRYVLSQTLTRSHAVP